MKKTKRFAIIIYAIILLLSFTVEAYYFLEKQETPIPAHGALISAYDIINTEELYVVIAENNSMNPDLRFRIKNKNDIIMVIEYLNSLALWNDGNLYSRSEWPFLSILLHGPGVKGNVSFMLRNRVLTQDQGDYRIDERQLDNIIDFLYALYENKVSFETLDKECSDWAYDYIRTANDHFILFGYHRYNYQKPIYRYEFAEMIYNLLSLDEYYEGERIFKDTKNCYIETLYDKGIINGKDTDLFCPYDYITREEASTILARASKYLIEKHGIVPLELQTSEFTDRADISDWAIESVEQMQKIGVLSGYEDGTFRPRGTITKEEAVTAMVNVLMLSVDDEVKLRKNT